MTDWSFPPDLQAQYERVLAQTRRLQQELGITPRTIEQRHQDYLARKAEEQRIKEELDKIQALTGHRRPPIKWKV
jgi:isopentenyldiphosphate isomerase